MAIFSGVYDYIFDGIALTLNRLVAQLERDGVEVLVFAPTTKTPAFQHTGTLVPVPSIPMPMRAEYRVSIGLGRRARRELEAFRPNLFHVAAPDILGWRALRFARQENIPVLASYHTRYETYFKYYGAGFAQTLVSGYLSRFYRQADWVCAPTESMAKEIEKAGYGRDISVWGRGVDTGRFNPKKRSKAWREKLGIGADELVVLFVSRLVREKNLGVLADVLSGMKARKQAFRAVIVGDGPERAALETKIPDAVFTGFLSGEELAKAYASADIFFFASLTETFGSVTLEAMASGLPVVCADATGSSSLVVPGVTGFVVAGDNVEAYADRLSQLLQNRALRQRLGTAGQERAATFTQSATYRQLRHVYAKLLGTH